MIPKVIHYCWFGGKPLPETAQKCMDSWKKFCPDYEMKRWDETNFDLSECEYVREACEAKRWAFVSDYVRLKVLYEYGGIYMDTDVEVVQSLDSILPLQAVSGFETNAQVPTGLIAAEKGMPMIGELLSEYDGLHFVRADGTFDLTTNVTRITKTFLKYGLKQNNTLQVIKGFTLFPKDYLCPKDFATGEVPLTENTLAVHHFEGSWLPQEEQDITKLRYHYVEKYHSCLLARFLSLTVVFTRNYGLFKAPFKILERKRNNQMRKNECSQ